MHSTKGYKTTFKRYYSFFGSTSEHEQNVAYLDQLLSVLVQLFQNWQCLLGKTVLQNTLDHSAAIGVCGQSKHLRNTCMVNTHTNGFHLGEPLQSPLKHQRKIHLHIHSSGGFM